MLFGRALQRSQIIAQGCVLLRPGQPETVAIQGNPTTQQTQNSKPRRNGDNAIHDANLRVKIENFTLKNRRLFRCVEQDEAGNGLWIFFGKAADDKSAVGMSYEDIRSLDEEIDSGMFQQGVQFVRPVGHGSALLC